MFDASQTLMWKDHAPPKDTDANTIVLADEQIAEEDQELLSAQFKSDMFKLQRDIAQIGRLYELDQGNTRSRRLRKMTHLREQNALGALQIQKFMNHQCRHVHFESPDLDSTLLKVGLSIQQQVTGSDGTYMLLVFMVTTQSPEAVMLCSVHE